MGDNTKKESEVTTKKKSEVTTMKDAENIRNETCEAGTSKTTSLRRSQRKKSATFKIYQTPLDKPSKPTSWTKNEKSQLLEGLKAVGDRDVSNLVKYVPTKNPEQIKRFIAFLKRKSRSQYSESSDEPLYFMDMWIRKLIAMSKSVERHEFDPLPLSLLLISLFEEFPSPSEAGGVDFQKLYEFLFCQMEELPLPKLDKSTEQFFYRSLREIEKDIVSNMDVLIEDLKNNKDMDEWPYNDPIWNPLCFSKLQLNVVDEDSD